MNFLHSYVKKGGGRVNSRNHDEGNFQAITAHSITNSTHALNAVITSTTLVLLVVNF